MLDKFERYPLTFEGPTPIEHLARHDGSARR